MRQTDTRISKPADARYELDSRPGLSLPDMVRPLRAHKWFILTCTLVCLLSSALYVSLKAPVYEAVASVRVDPGRAGSLGLNDMVAAPLADSGNAVNTEIAVIKSDGVAIRTLNSLTNDEFRTYTGLPKDQIAIPLYSEVLSAPQGNLIALLKANTTVKQEEGTQLVDISFRDKNPQVAAMIVTILSPPTPCRTSPAGLILLLSCEPGYLPRWQRSSGKLRPLKKSWRRSRRPTI